MNIDREFAKDFGRCIYVTFLVHMLVHVSALLGAMLNAVFILTISPHVRESGFLNREMFGCGIWDPENLICGIRNPGFSNLEYSSRNSESN